VTRRHVVLQAEAQLSLEEALTFYSKRSRDGMTRWFAAFERTVERMGEDADRFPRATEADRLGIDLRVATFGTRPMRPTHRLLFTFDDARVDVVALLHHAQRDYRAD
jgi:plasmid stabilization system protein ParE